MEQLGSHWADLHENLYLIIIRKSAQKVHVSLIRDKRMST
jgi:hypothetical protein